MGSVRGGLRVPATALLALLLALVLAPAAPVQGSAGSAERPGLSGTSTFEGHTMTWATGGVSPVPANRPDLAASYDGVVAGGATVTFSGTMTFVIGAGYVTNLSQNAGISGGTSSPSTSFSQRVGGTTITTPYTLTTRAPWTKDLPAADNGVAATMTASVSSKNCNDWGVCGGPSVQLVFAVMKSAGGGPTANKPPTIAVLPPSGVVRIGQRIPVAWRLKDDSRVARWFAALYSGGTVVSTGKSSGLVRAVGAVDRAMWPRSGGGTGPFFTCFYAEDKPGLRSDGAPMSSCRWLSVQVPVPSVSNGCGAATWGPYVADLLNWIGDVRMYGSTPVNIRPACNQHDAGYAGVTVAGITSPRPVDYRTWSRAQVDEKFYDDIVRQCRRFLTGSANAAYLKACREDAVTYVGLVRQYGQAAFDADVTVPGEQSVVPASTNPPGGARDNS